MFFHSGDFVQYWAAGRLHVAGGNPYSSRELLPLERLAGLERIHREAIMCWTPPWTLPLYWPAAALEPRWGHLLWNSGQLFAVLLSASWLWRTYGGPARPAALLAAPQVAALVFAPTAWMLYCAQTSGLLLLGVAGFLHAWGRGRPAEAGLWAALTAVKPHLLALWGLCLVLDGLAGGSRRALLAGAGAVAAFGLLALAPNPDIYSKYAQAAAAPAAPEFIPLSHWKAPTLGYQLRRLVTDGEGDPAAGFAWQFVPLAVAAPLTAAYWWRRRADWDWSVETPRLVGASVLASPYGAWITDLVVLLALAVPLAARLAATRTWTALAAGAVLAAALLASLPASWNPRLSPSMTGHVWFAPATVILCIVLGRAARQTSDSPHRGEPCSAPQ